MAASAIDKAVGGKSSPTVCVMLTNQNRILNSAWSDIKCYFFALFIFWQSQSFYMENISFDKMHLKEYA